MMFVYGHSIGWLGYAGMGIVMVLFFALLIVGIVTLIRFSTGDQSRPVSPSSSRPPSPEHVLADRFGRGEISEAEYRDRLAAILRAQQ